MKFIVALFAVLSAIAQNVSAAPAVAPPVVDLAGWQTLPGHFTCYSNGLRVRTQTFLEYRSETVMRDLRRVDRWTENGVVVVEHHYERKDGVQLFNDYYVREGNAWSKFHLPDQLEAYFEALARGPNVHRTAPVSCKK